MKRSMADVRRRSAETGHHWFSRKTMQFFKSRIESTLYKNGCFVTSEEPPYGARRYSVRRAMADGSIETVGDFMAYRHVEDARAAARRASA